jgi:hypothetical protein
MLVKEYRLRALFAMSTYRRDEVKRMSGTMQTKPNLLIFLNLLQTAPYTKGINRYLTSRMETLRGI